MANLQSFDASGLCTGIDYVAQNTRTYPEYSTDLYPPTLIFSASGKYAMEAGSFSSGAYLSSQTTRFTGSYRFNLHKFDEFGAHTLIGLDLGSYGSFTVTGVFIGTTNKILFYPGKTTGAGTLTIPLTVYDCDAGTFTDFTSVATGITTASGVICSAVGFSETAFMLVVGDADHAASGTKIFGAWTATAIGGAFTSKVSVNSTGVNQQVIGMAIVASINRFVVAFDKYALAQIAYSSATLTGTYSVVTLGTKRVFGYSNTPCIESPHDLTNSHVIVLDTADTKYKLTSDFSSFFDTGITYGSGDDLARFGNMCYATAEGLQGYDFPNSYYNYDGATQTTRYTQGATPEVGGNYSKLAAYNHKPEMFLRYAQSDNTELCTISEVGRRM